MKISLGRSQISLNINQLGENRSEGEGLDFWVSTQKEKWPGSDIDSIGVDSEWQKLTKVEHDRLRRQVLQGSRWLRDHVEERSGLFHPLKHPQGPSQAKHVPRIRISSFADEQRGLYDVFIDDWRRDDVKRSSMTSPRRGWTAFVDEVPAQLKKNDQFRHPRKRGATPKGRCTEGG